MNISKQTVSTSQHDAVIADENDDGVAVVQDGDDNDRGEADQQLRHEDQAGVREGGDDGRPPGCIHTIQVRRAVITKAPLRVQFLLTFWGVGGKSKKLWLY